MSDRLTKFLPPRAENVNATTYSRAAILRLYIDEKWLSSEASLLLDYGSDILSKRVLELGAGSGRIASLLKNRAAEYCATDINPEMVRSFRASHPDVRALIADARRLEAFADGVFDTVIFSFNGLDSLSFTERPTALSEVYRVLRFGGAFIHSTHNLFHARAASHRPKLLGSGGSPLQYLRRRWNRFRLARHEYYSSKYAVVNDRSLHNGLLNVYVRPDIHFAQLDAAGFRIDAVYERSGRKLPKNVSPTDQWFYVVARKNSFGEK